MSRRGGKPAHAIQGAVAMTGFRDDPAFLRDEAIRQAALATGAMREADDLRQQLRGAVAERDALRLAIGIAIDMLDDGTPNDSVVRTILLDATTTGGQ